MTQTIEWHKNCLKNMKVCLANHEDDLLRSQEKVAKLKADINTRETQIVEAERAGRSSFDQEKFLVKRKKK